MKYECVICGNTLKEAPTKKWWQRTSGRYGICDECILRLAKKRDRYVSEEKVKE